MNSRRTSGAQKLILTAALVGLGVLAACTAGRDARPEVMPENAIQSSSPDELPGTPSSGLGTPGGLGDAGLPHMPLDGSVPRGNGQVP